MGLLLGFLSGLGIGGGSLLLLWLTLALGIDSTTARGINLLFFLPASAISCFVRWKQGSLNPKTVLPAIFSGCIGSGLGIWIAKELDTEILQKGFGLLLLATGIRELFYRTKHRESK